MQGTFLPVVHMRTVALNASSMCWRWRRQACRCSFIRHFFLIYCRGYERPPGGCRTPVWNALMWRSGRDDGTGGSVQERAPSRWNVLSVSAGSLWLFTSAGASREGSSDGFPGGLWGCSRCSVECLGQSRGRGRWFQKSLIPFGSATDVSRSSGTPWIRDKSSSNPGSPALSS